MEKGVDVAEILGVLHYEKPQPFLPGEAKGNFPTHLISKTDEERIQNCPRILDQFFNKECYVTMKLDGSSISILNTENEGFMVCSRNLVLKENLDSIFFKAIEKYNLKEKLPIGFGCQAECYGEKIQGNPLKIEGVDIAVFNIIELNNRRLLGLDEMISFCEKIGVPTVPIIYRGEFYWKNCNELEQYASQLKYPKGNFAEGCVIRLTNPEYCARLNKETSFKVINPEYKD